MAPALRATGPAASAARPAAWRRSPAAGRRRLSLAEELALRPRPLRRGPKRGVLRRSGSQHAAAAKRGLRRLVGWYVAEAAGSLRKARYLIRGFFVGFVAARASKSSRSSWEIPARLGREDESVLPEAVEEKPTVLTDQVCLIPGDAPVVRVEDAPGNARRIFTGVDIRASVEDVWSVMTDYEGLKQVVPNLVHNQILRKTENGGARLWQIGRASWQILGRNFYFQAGTTLDVRLFPEGLPEEHIAGALRDAAALSSAEARAVGKTQQLVRDVYPRPFSISAEGVPVHDITMQNVKGERGDFVHYQGVWRLQPLDGCAAPGQDMMRLTFAVECEPHWFLPVAPVEGRIAHALVENMEAIRTHVEAVQRQRGAEDRRAEDHRPEPSSARSDSASSSRSTASATSSSSTPFGGGAEDALDELAAGLTAAAEQAANSLVEGAEAVQRFLEQGLSQPVPGLAPAPASPRKEPSTAGRPQAAASRLPGRGLGARRRPAGGGRGRLAGAGGPLARRPGVALQAIQEAEALAEAMTRTLERAEVGAAAESTGAFVSTIAEVAFSLEADTLLAASLAAGLAAAAANLAVASEHHRNPSLEFMEPEEVIEGDDTLSKVWLAVCKQHPSSVREGRFLGMPFGREDVEKRWPRFVQVLGVSEEQALEIVETDATPLLVEPDDVAEVLSRLAAISSREKALELVGWNPALLVGGAPALKDGQDLGVSILADVLYAGRLNKVLDECGRDTTEKLAEIEWYSYAVTGVKPLLDFFQHGAPTAATSRLCRRPIEIAAQIVPNAAVRVFLARLATVPDPLGFMADQAKAGLFMVSLMARRPSLATSIAPYSPSIVPHLPAIYTRLSILRPHIPGIARILDKYFSVVEPHLDRIMERMDEIEPHLPYILIHLDVLAKHCGPLLDHFDELMPYASSKADIGNVENWQACYEERGGRRPTAESIAECVIEWDELEERPAHEIERATEEESYLPRLLPYVDFLVPRLEILAPHLPLVHPHLPHILPYIDRLLPYIPLFAAHPKASANADVLVGYLGWMLRVPLLPKVLYIPVVPRIIANLSTVLPRRFIRPALERRRRRREEAERLAEKADKQVAKRDPTPR